jgi:hypothetical protein
MDVIISGEVIMAEVTNNKESSSHKILGIAKVT